MIACKHCDSKNSIDSQFCKSCGLELSETDRAAAEAATEKLVADGYTLLGQSRTEEAALVAEKVLEDEPRHAGALSLLGMCHERNGDILAALECYEKVVEVKPDSALDKIKVTQLRNALARQSKEDVKPTRSMALVGAMAAIILVGSIGGIVATVAARPAAANLVAKNDDTSHVVGNGFTDTRINYPQTSQAQTQNQGTVDPDQNRDKPTGTQGDAGGTIHRPWVQPGINTDVLPRPDGNGQKTTIGNENGEGSPPVKPDFTYVPTGPTGGTGGTDNDPKPDQGNNGNIITNPAPDPKDDKGTIEIHVHKSTPVGNGGSVLAQDNDGTGLQAVMKVAQEQFLLGKYQAAAGNYERAIAYGGDSGRIHQRIAQCYERMGKTSEAISAYSKAEAALQAAVTGGRASAKPALESVRQALHNLRGD